LQQLVFALITLEVDSHVKQNQSKYMLGLVFAPNATADFILQLDSVQDVM
jgi:hypothetical protein